MANVKDYPPYLDYPKQRKTQTNADRIRAMSDEELAEFLCRVYDDDYTLGKLINGWLIPSYDAGRIKKWLKQPVEDE